MPNLYQLSTLSALLLGDFEPSLSIGELKRHGTLGIGTFEGLGGELIMLDGVVWNGSHTGEAAPAADITAERNVQAEIIGFRFPGYLESINRPGWHLHVLTAPNDSGKRFGGHLLNITADAGIEAQWMAADGLELTFPTGEAGRIYDALPLDQDLREITKPAEG